MNNESCIFCKIGRGEIPSYKVYEDNEVLAFLDINPASRGHTLVITKEHFSSRLTCPKNILDHAFEVAQLVAQAAVSQLGATGVNFISNAGASAGQTVQHFHIYVIPRYDHDVLKLNCTPRQLTDGEGSKLQQTISSRRNK